jgi:2-iminobutanoate/2-iminopropanoate deaminase
MKNIISDKAPKAVGPYSHAVKYKGLVFTAGQIAINPKTNLIVEGDISVQTKQTIENLKIILEESGSSLEKALKVSVFLKDLNDFQKMNEVYGIYFKNKPARSTVEVSNLPKGALIEIDVIAEYD